MAAGGDIPPDGNWPTDNAVNRIIEFMVVLDGNLGIQHPRQIPVLRP